MTTSRDVLLTKMRTRVNLDRGDGDIAGFYALGLFAEYLTKVVTAGTVACLGDDVDRHRYTLEHKLVRASAVGEWTEALDNVLTGRASQFFSPSARDLVRDLTERVASGDWRYSVVSTMNEVAQLLQIEGVNIGAKVALRQFFTIWAVIRNKTRGHGAPTIRQCSEVTDLMEKALDSVANNIKIFRLPWVHLHRNLSGKYRVSQLLGDCAQFEYLRRTHDVRLLNGTYFFLDRPIHVPLICSDPDLLDILLPNGDFRGETFEIRSYITNEMRRQDGVAWTAPPSRLPASETEGKPALDAIGNVFSNLPPKPRGYISRLALEDRLRVELTQTERHPLVSLTGPGGIGKTTLALAVLEALVHMKAPPYDVVLWLSARDIDLLDIGPKPVAPRVVTKTDIARATAELLECPKRFERVFEPESHFEQCLSNGAAGPTLFVLDNFETFENPADVFEWIDTHIRPPNKVLITTRHRDFDGDYSLEVSGMTDDEAHGLIDREAVRLRIAKLLTGEYCDQVISESDGHPYVIKILLGEVAKHQKLVKPERIVATREHLLRTLFERTYATLNPGAQRVFLLLCSWRVLVPEIAVEAVLLRPANERFDMSGSLEELRRFSFVEEVISECDGQPFLGVPLAAAIFGRLKLETSPFKAAVEDDRGLLMEFGAGKREDVGRGALPRVERLMATIARKAADGDASLEETLPILEYLASRIPKAFLRLSDLAVEFGDCERALGYLRRFLESAEPQDREGVWLRIAEICSATGDVVGEVHALSEVAQAPTATTASISSAANRINNRVVQLKGRRIEDEWSPEVKLLLERVAMVMERKLPKLSATDCSRLAWLLLNIGNEERARDVAKVGLERDVNNYYCANLLSKIGR